MAEKITKDMNLKELLNKYPDSAKVFATYGIGCLGCALASYETIQQGINAHGINLDDFLKELNSVLNLTD